MTGATQSTFGGGTSRPSRVTNLPPRKVETPAKYTTTYTPDRKFKVGTKPTVKYTTTTVVNNRTVYVYPGGGYSYTPMGSIIGYYDAPRVSYVPVPTPVYNQPVYDSGYNSNSSSSLGSFLFGFVVVVLLIGLVALFLKTV